MKLEPTWQTADGSVRLFLGDCLDVLPTLEAVDCTVTSPPYNQLENIDPDKLSGTWAIKGIAGKPKGAFTGNGYFDGLNEADYQQQQLEIFEMCAVATGPRGSLFYNHQIRWRDGNLLHPVDWFKPDGWRLRQEIIWDRCGGMMFNARMFCRFDERILWFVRGQHKWNQSEVGHGTVWRIAREQNKPHPVAFPDEIPHRCISAATDPGDLVFDPYMGSATTGIAAMQLGRRFVGVEREPAFFDIAVKRISDELNRAPLFDAAPEIVQRELI